MEPYLPRKAPEGDFTTISQNFFVALNSWPQYLLLTIKMQERYRRPEPLKIKKYACQICRSPKSLLYVCPTAQGIDVYVGVQRTIFIHVGAGDL